MMTTDIRRMSLLMMVLGLIGTSVRLTIRLVLRLTGTGHIALAATPAGVDHHIEGGAGVDIGDLVVVGRSPHQA